MSLPDRDLIKHAIACILHFTFLWSSFYSNLPSISISLFVRQVSLRWIKAWKIKARKSLLVPGILGQFLRDENYFTVYQGMLHPPSALCWTKGSSADRKLPLILVGVFSTRLPNIHAISVSGHIEASEKPREVQWAWHSCRQGSAKEPHPETSLELPLCYGMAQPLQYRLQRSIDRAGTEKKTGGALKVSENWLNSKESRTQDLSCNLTPLLSQAEFHRITTWLRLE